METRSPHDTTATPRAFADGCYSGTWWYDTTGGVWTVAEATLKQRPSLLERWLQRPVAVQLRFGPRAEGDLTEALNRIREVMRSDNEFCDSLKTPPDQILTQLQSARSTADLGAIASRFD